MSAWREAEGVDGRVARGKDHTYTSTFVLPKMRSWFPLGRLESTSHHIPTPEQKVWEQPRFCGRIRGSAIPHIARCNILRRGLSGAGEPWRTWNYAVAYLELWTATFLVQCPRGAVPPGKPFYKVATRNGNFDPSRHYNKLCAALVLREDIIGWLRWVAESRVPVGLTSCSGLRGLAKHPWLLASPT